MERNSRDGAAETVFGITAVLTGGGALTFALFPFLLPTVVLLGVLAIPLLPVALLAAVALGAFIALRTVGRVVSRALPARRRAPSARAPELRAEPR